MSMCPDLAPLTGRARDKERGAALAELAMVVPLMLALLLVVFDLGRGFLAYISVSNGARDGARVAIQNDIECDNAGVGTAVRNGAGQYGSEAAFTFNATVVSGRCQVTASYTYTPILPFVTSSFSLPFVGTVGPLWNGTMSETMVSE
jgi:Flp pilus assembly protein TadG